MDAISKRPDAKQDDEDDSKNSKSELKQAINTVSRKGYEVVKRRDYDDEDHEMRGNSGTRQSAANYRSHNRYDMSNFNASKTSPE